MSSFLLFSICATYCTLSPAIEASYRAASKCFMFMYFLLPHWVPATWRSPAQTGGAPNAVEELKQYKALLDAGVLTEEEFVAKKRQLLGI